MNSSDKAALRRRIREAFPGQEIRKTESEALCGHVMRWTIYRQANVVAAYMPLYREADLSLLLKDILQQGKTLLLPRVEGETISLRSVGSMEELTPGAWGIMEPAANAPVVKPEKVDLLIVPLEGIDHSGMRLGKGGGYYDRLLKNAACPTLGAVLSWQWQENIPAQSWDIPLRWAADHKGIHLFDQRY